MNDTVDRPGIPFGRPIELLGRGTTFVREVPGPNGAPTVLLLHGCVATAALNWRAVFEPLGRHYHVVALDHRGHGRGVRFSPTLSPGRLRRRCGGAASGARHRAGDRRRLLDGWPGCATSLATPPSPCRRARTLRHVAKLPPQLEKAEQEVASLRQVTTPPDGTARSSATVLERLRTYVTTKTDDVTRALGTIMAGYALDCVVFPLLFGGVLLGFARRLIGLG